MFQKILRFLLLLSILCCYESEAIYNGTLARAGEFPFIVSLRNGSTGIHYCGGTLVTPKHVVTAAHCLYDEESLFYGQTLKKLKPKDVFVVVGTLYSRSMNYKYDIETIAAHPEFNVLSKNWLLNDVGVITLKKEVSIKNVKPIPLPVKQPQLNALGVTAGWGYWFENSTQPAYRLLKMYVKIQHKGICAAEWATKGPITKDIVKQLPSPKILCARPIRNNAGACRRDSGGPLVVRGDFVGIILAGYPCAQNVSDLYTSVPAHQEFITSQIRSSTSSLHNFLNKLLVLGLLSFHYFKLF